MKSFQSAIEIAAPASQIWSLLTDAAGYPTWNSIVEKIDGRIAPGEKVKVFTKAVPGRAFPVTVTEFEPTARMIWTGGMPLGLFTGARTYTLEPKSNGRTLFSMSEVFSGLLAPMIAKSIPNLQPAFDTFAADLKRRAENGGQQS
jgi:hypothetical protein